MEAPKKQIVKVKGPLYYNTHIPEDLNLIATWRRLYNKVIDFLPADTNTAIVDLGCGPGYFAEALYRRGYRVYWGIDFAKVCLKMAREAVPEFKYTFASLYSKLIQERFSNYDVFILIEILEHLDRDIFVLNAIPQGKKVIFSVPNRGGEGHVRTLISQEQVAARYGNAINFSDSLVLPGSNYGLEKRDDGIYIGKVFFLVHGMRK